MQQPKHKYVRELSEEPEGSLALLAKKIPNNAQVLELGPASGYFTKFLHLDLHCLIDAVEQDEVMAEQARPWCRKLVIGDLEKIELAKLFSQNTYDAIVVADVLEHVRNPAALLQQLPCLLKPRGSILLSVPNVAYAGLVLDLLEGRFEYRTEGLLDKSHLRFFTRQSLESLITDCGLFAWDWLPVYRPLAESEFKYRLESLPRGLSEVVLKSPYALCYQWVVEIKKFKSDAMVDEPAPCNTDTYPIRVFYHDNDSGTSRERNQVIWGGIGIGRQKLCLELPELYEGRIRINLADRAGYVRLYAFKITSRSGNTEWVWSPREGIDALKFDLDRMQLCQADDHVLALLERDASWLVLNKIDLALAAGGQLEMEIGWPMSADYIAASHGWESALSKIKETTANTNQPFIAGRSENLKCDPNSGVPTEKTVNQSWLARWFARRKSQR